MGKVEYRYCTGPDTSSHQAALSGFDECPFGDCPVCNRAIELYESQSGKLYDTNGTHFSTCDGCGQLTQGTHICENSASKWKR